ncbi:MAG TPA: 2Fe-2S iron-sulfur cluster-binding protein [Flavobacteriaceae bacterium]|nr:2Fe-2S iron-sulfur cluster-binding protein [Flavobacteriaceae bacterium]
MAQFHKLKIRDIYKETEDCSVIDFEIPQELQSEFAFRQGQHLTLKTTINGEDVRRSYSLCSGPTDNIWKVAVKQIFEGKFSTFANSVLKKGDFLDVMAPVGEFGVPIEANKEKDYVAFVAGSGITPVLSMIKAHLALEPKSKFRLFYLNKTAKSIIFKEEIEAIRNIYLGRFEVFYFLDEEHRTIELLNGRFTPEKLKELDEKIVDFSEIDECFICGPEPMIFLIRDELMKLGLAKEKIHYELFVSGLSEEAKQRAAAALKRRAKNGTDVTILDGGKEFHFTMAEEYDNILDAALAAGADLPFACKGGVCSTCKCKLLEGDVEMKVNYALEEDEVKKDFILSCQAVPTSKKVVVDFDV